MTSNASPIINLPMMYMNGLAISNNATTPDEKIDIALGQCRDSTNTFDMVLSAGVTINVLHNGINGLDTGSIDAEKVYGIYLISDPVSGQPTGAILSLSLSAPLMPNDYLAYRLIGCIATDTDSDLLLGSWSAGNTGNRKFAFDAPQITAVSAGNATSYTAVSLAKWVPAINNAIVSMAFAFTPGAASRTLKMTPGNGVGDAVTITGQVTSVVVSGNAELFSKVTAGVPEIDYKVANSGDAVAFSVAGYSLVL